MSELRKGVKIACFPLTTRPGFPGVPPSLDGDYVTDAYSRVSFQYVQADGAWRPTGSTRAAINYWIDPNAGNDANDGAAATPLRTFGEAARRIPPHVRHDVIIRFIDGGNPVLLDEQVEFKDHTLVNASIYVVGNTRPAVIVGPNVVAPNPANFGNYWALTIPGPPIWVPGSLIGLRVRFTAGPHAGVRCYIINNSPNTLVFGYRPGPGTGPYGPLDGLTIEENLETLQLTTGVFQTPTLAISNVRAELSFISTPRLIFQDITVGGDNTLGMSVVFSGNCIVGFTRCRLDDLVGSFVMGASTIFLFDSMLWTTRLFGAYEDFVPFPGYAGETLNLYIGSTGIRGGFYAGPQTSLDMYNCNGEEDPLAPVGHVIRYGGHKAVLADVGLNGVAISIPFCLDRLAYGGISLDAVDFTGSPNAGLGPLNANAEMMNVLLDLDYNPSQPSEFQGNATYGIDGTGLKIHVWGPVRSTGLNGVGGLRLRKGGFLKVNTLVLPTLCGPIPGLTEIDFDNRAPIVFTNWGAVATGLQTLCHQE